MTAPPCPSIDGFELEVNVQPMFIASAWVLGSSLFTIGVTVGPLVTITALDTLTPSVHRQYSPAERAGDKRNPLRVLMFRWK